MLLSPKYNVAYTGRKIKQAKCKQGQKGMSIHKQKTDYHFETYR